MLSGSTGDIRKSLGIARWLSVESQKRSTADSDSLAPPSLSGDSDVFEKEEWEEEPKRDSEDQNNNTVK